MEKESLKINPKGIESKLGIVEEEERKGVVNFILGERKPLFDRPFNAFGLRHIQARSVEAGLELLEIVLEVNFDFPLIVLHYFLVETQQTLGENAVQSENFHQLHGLIDLDSLLQVGFEDLAKLSCSKLVFEVTLKKLLV